MTNLPHYSDLVLNHWRPGGVDAHFNPWSTLTHGDFSASIPVVSALGVWNPASNTLAVILADGDTLNLRSLAGLRLGVQPTGTVSSALYSTNGTCMGPPVTAAIAGDLQVTAQLTSLTPSGTVAQGGLMVRESVSAGARQVFLSLAPSGSNMVGFCFRTNQSSIAAASSTPAPSGPLWLRLVRFGNVLSGYYSTNGNT